MSKKQEMTETVAIPMTIRFRQDEIIGWLYMEVQQFKKIDWLTCAFSESIELNADGKAEVKEIAIVPRVTRINKGLQIVDGKLVFKEK